MIDKAALFKPRLEERTVDLDGVGEIRVRALSRAESMDIPDLSGSERIKAIISRGMVEPTITPDEVEQWMAASPAGELDHVAKAIGELSGLMPSSGKDAYKSAGEQPDA